jgi:hypothetical protein
MHGLLAERRHLIRLLIATEDRPAREQLHFEIQLLDAKAGLDEDRGLAEVVAGVEVAS